MTSYGMGDCRSFLSIPPLVHWEDGSTCLNPDFNAVTKFHRSALGADPTGYSGALVPEVILGPNDVVNFQLTVDREENGMGHFLINELLLLTDPDTSRGLKVTIKDKATDRVFMNQDVFETLLFGNAQLNCCLPCPVMVFPNQTLIFRVENTALLDVKVRIVARGKRFMPYHNQGLVNEMTDCWMRNPSMPFWLTMDDTEVTIPGAVAGTPGSAQSQMTVPGGGWFELAWPRCEVEIAGALTDGSDVTVAVTEGRIGPQAQNVPIPMSLYATPTLPVAGFPGGYYRAASACHCEPPKQVYRGNTRIIHDFRNYNANPATIRLTYAGCFHFVDVCPPQADLDAARRGDEMFNSCSLILDPEWSCPEPTSSRKSGVAGLGRSPQGDWERI